MIYCETEDKLLRDGGQGEFSFSLYLSTKTPIFFKSLLVIYYYYKEKKVLGS